MKLTREAADKTLSAVIAMQEACADLMRNYPGLSDPIVRRMCYDKMRALDPSVFIEKGDSVHVDKPLAESAVAPGECGSVPTDSQILQKLREVDHAGHIQWAGNPWLKRVVLDFARAVLGMQPPNTAGQPNEQNDVVGEGK